MKTICQPSGAHCLKALMDKVKLPKWHHVKKGFYHIEQPSPVVMQVNFTTKPVLRTEQDFFFSGIVQAASVTHVPFAIQNHYQFKMAKNNKAAKTAIPVSSRNLLFTCTTCMKYL